MKTRAVGDQQGGELAIEIEWKTAPAAEARKVIGKKQSYTLEDWKKCFKVKTYQTISGKHVDCIRAQDELCIFGICAQDESFMERADKLIYLHDIKIITIIHS